MGLGHGEKSQVGKESFWPPFMIVQTATHPRMFFLLASDRSQPSSHKAIDSAKGHRMRVLKVAEPALKYRVQFLNDRAQTVSPCPSGLGPNTIAQRFDALWPHPPLPCLEPISEELDPLARLPAVAHVAFLQILLQLIATTSRLLSGQPDSVVTPATPGVPLTPQSAPPSPLALPCVSPTPAQRSSKSLTCRQS